MKKSADIINPNHKNDHKFLHQLSKESTKTLGVSENPSTDMS